MTHHYEDREPRTEAPVSVEVRDGDGLRPRILDTSQPPYTPKKETPVSDIHCDASDREYQAAADRKAKEEPVAVPPVNPVVSQHLAERAKILASYQNNGDVPPGHECKQREAQREVKGPEGNLNFSLDAQRMAPKCLTCGAALMDNDLMFAIERRALSLGTTPVKVYATLKLQVLQAEVDKLQAEVDKLQRTLASNG